MIKNITFTKDKGFAAIYITILVLAVIFALTVSIFVLTYNEQKIIQNLVKSTQSYYAAEAGIEDALLRLTNSMDWSIPYSFNVGNGFTQVEIANIIGGARTITSEGNISNRTKKVQVIFAVSTQQVSFYYGAQVGEGGMSMGNNSRVQGNIYANGSVVARTGVGYIDDTVIVAVNGNRIEGLEVGQDAKAHTCKNSTIAGTLTYVSGGALENCTAGETVKEQPNEILPKDMPISQSQIDDWKQEAELDGIIIGDYTIPISDFQNLGPVKIEGNLLIENNATLNQTGTIWVTGDLRVNNGAAIQLDFNSYGPLSGLIIIDGKTKIRPDTDLRGTGESGSYVMILSTNPEVLDETNPAIEIDNNTDAAIFYASQGLIVLKNNVQAREVTGYKVFLENNAEILYESGLQDTSFSTGPGGSWEIATWREIE
jgi:hypothetical protein